METETQELTTAPPVPAPGVTVATEVPSYESHSSGLVIAVQLEEKDQFGRRVGMKTLPPLKFQGIKRGTGLLRLTPDVVAASRMSLAELQKYLESSGHFIDMTAEADKPEGLRRQPGDPNCFWRLEDAGKVDTARKFEELRDTLAKWNIDTLRARLAAGRQAIPVRAEKDTDDAYRGALAEALYEFWSGQSLRPLE